MDAAALTQAEQPIAWKIAQTKGRVQLTGSALAGRATDNEKVVAASLHGCSMLPFSGASVQVKLAEVAA